MATPQNRPWTLRAPWAALLLSLAAHGALALLLALVPARGMPCSPAVDGTLVVDDTRPALQLTLLDPQQTRRTPSAAPPGPPGEEEETPGTADYQVQLVDAASPSSAVPAAAPVLPSPAPAAAAQAATPTAAAPQYGSGLSDDGPHGSGGAGGGNLPAAPPSATRVVYVVDRSISMGEGRALAAACAEVVASLRRLPPGSVFQVVLFNQLAEPLRLDGRPAELLNADDATVRQVEEALRGLPATGATRPVEAVCRGLKYRPEVLYLLTDADELGRDDVTKLARETGGRTVIHTVELCRHAGGAGGPLAELAARTGGKYRRVAPGG